MLAVTDKERVMLLFDVIVPVPHCTEQWGFSNVNTEILPPLTVATFPLFGTACFYTSQNNLYASTFGYNNGRITIVCEASYSGAQGFWLILCK